MPTHTVKAGECLLTIAEKYGFPWKTLWELGANSKLKNARKHPTQLVPGDELVVPEEREVKKHSAATDKAHSFKVKGSPVLIRLCLVDSGKALANEPYTLEVGGKIIKDKTDGDGKIEKPVPPLSGDAVLTLDKRNQKFTLKLGGLGPVTDVAGAQARLANLGHYGGKVDGKIGPITRKAVTEFQKLQGIKESGELDKSTTDALAKAYGY